MLHGKQGRAEAETQNPSITAPSPCMARCSKRRYALIYIGRSRMTIATTLAPAEQKAFYDERGYILHPDLLTQDELATLRAALAEVLEESRGLTESNDKFS